jgi:hypothetical protein
MGELTCRNPFTKRIYYQKKWGDAAERKAEINKPVFKYGWISEVILVFVLLGWIFVPFVKWWMFIIALVITAILRGKKVEEIKIEEVD